MNAEERNRPYAKHGQLFKTCLESFGHSCTNLLSLMTLHVAAALLSMLQPDIKTSFFTFRMGQVDVFIVCIFGISSLGRSLVAELPRVQLR